MHGIAWLAATAGLPDSNLFHLGQLADGIPIQAFGVIVAVGVLIGAALLRRYAEWHGVEDLKIRELTGWVTITGFIGAHLFDVIAYQWNDVKNEPILLLELWKGISSYGGFIGGAMGFAFYVWWKRLPPRLMADITIVGLLPAFSIGRIGCTTVSDHVGAFVDPDKWYSFLAVDYKGDFLRESHFHDFAGTSHLAWNLGLIELLYLIPVNALILWLAFRPSKVDEKPWTQGRPNAGFITVVTGVLYAPVRFGLDFLRPEDSDPRYFGLTFAQWASIVAFGVAVYAAVRIFQGGKAAEPVTRTSKEAQQKLKAIGLKSSEPDGDDKKSGDGSGGDDDKKDVKKAKKAGGGKKK
jgi:phosphatidylglycerol:prolipoprotein diacylglycerol transferase